MIEQPEVAVAAAKTTSKAARDPELVAFDEDLDIPVVDDATLRGKGGETRYYISVIGVPDRVQLVCLDSLCS